MAPSGPPAKAAAAAADPKAKAKGKAKPKAPKEEEEDPNRPEKPDWDLHNAALEEIQKVIEGFQAQQSELAAQIGARSGGKDEYFAKRNEYRAQLDEFTKKIDELMERKGALNKGISDKKQEGTDMRNQLSKMKKSIGYTTEGAIDDRIADIELWMRTESMTLKEEKEYMKEVSELKKNRPKVANVIKMEDSLQNRDTGSNLRENIGTINEEINLYRDGKRQVSVALSALNESRKEQLGDLPNCIEQRDEIGKKVKAEMDKRNALRDEYRQKDREYNGYLAEQRKKRAEKYNEERNAKNAEWEMERRQKKAESMDQQPYVSEVTLIEQTILFCKNLVADRGPVQQEEKKEVDHSKASEFEVLVSKDQREEEFYYAPTAAKKKAKGKKQGGKEGSAKPIKHNAETFKLFEQLKIDAPFTTADIPEKLEQLQAKLEFYQEKVKKWEKDRDELKQKILSGQATGEEEEAKAEEAAVEEKAEEEEAKADGEE